MNKYDQALQMAMTAHAGQTRKNSIEPYIEHPKRVAEILRTAGFREEVVIAGLLHDVVEDSPIQNEEIRAQFGKEVAEIVAYHTEDKSLTWEERKQHTIDTLKNAPKEVQALIIADKLDNIQSIIKQYKELGDQVWNAFKRGREQQSWYNHAIVDALGRSDNEPAYFQIYRELVQQFYPKE